MPPDAATAATSAAAAPTSSSPAGAVAGGAAAGGIGASAGVEASSGDVFTRTQEARDAEMRAEEDLDDKQAQVRNAQDTAADPGAEARRQAEMAGGGDAERSVSDAQGTVNAGVEGNLRNTDVARQAESDSDSVQRQARDAQQAPEDAARGVTDPVESQAYSARDQAQREGDVQGRANQMQDDATGSQVNQATSAKDSVERQGRDVSNLPQDTANNVTSGARYSVDSQVDSVKSQTDPSAVKDQAVDAATPDVVRQGQNEVDADKEVADRVKRRADDAKDPDKK
jgi:hypothetical protein